MNQAFEDAVDHTMKYEVGGFWNVAHPAVKDGKIDTRANMRAVGYIHDSADRGGETKFGVAQNANPNVSVTRLTWAQAKEIYYTKYWLAGKCDQLSPKLAKLHFDGCVNHGVRKANQFLQRAIGVNDDGVIGPVTMGKIRVTNERNLLISVCEQREKFYRDIVEGNPSQAKFLNGWLRRISEVRSFVLK